jgi:hypothetical protein
VQTSGSHLGHRQRRRAELSPSVSVVGPAKHHDGGSHGRDRHSDKQGYTRNELGGGTNGAKTLVPTGNLDLLHNTIKTKKGGDISILGSGGSMLVGSEPDTSLKLSDLGPLTLAGGSI